MHRAEQRFIENCRLRGLRHRRVGGSPTLPGVRAGDNVLRLL